MRPIMSMIKFHRHHHESNPRLSGSAVPLATASPRVACNTRRCSYASVARDRPVVRTVTWRAGKFVGKQATERHEA